MRLLHGPRALALLLLAGCAAAPERARRSEGGFVLAGRPFVPRGFNYDHDAKSRLIEEIWEDDPAVVESDFREMKALGANVVRVHLQLHRILRSATETSAEGLAFVDGLLGVAERTGLLLDVTGLCGYRKRDWPEWYESLAEKERWAAQARFWEAVAGRGARSPAVFAYNLMNEPVSPAAAGKDWRGGPLGEFHFVENITRDPAGRPRLDVTRQWIRTLRAAIRKHDPERLVTAGLFPLFYGNVRSLTLGEDVREIAAELDYLSVHLYPEDKKGIAGALDVLRAMAAVKPTVIEETFPLGCSQESFRRFLEESRGVAAGWIGFYWGRTREELRASREFGDQLLLFWLDCFRDIVCR
jgi:hypothetical protein